MRLLSFKDENLRNWARDIANTVLKYYPDDVMNLTNLALYHMSIKEYDEALPLLLKAESIDKKDTIVLSNIAAVYQLKNDDKNAIKYYKLVAKYGNDQMKSMAKKQIERLK